MDSPRASQRGPGIPCSTNYSRYAGKPGEWALPPSGKFMIGKIKRQRYRAQLRVSRLAWRSGMRRSSGSVIAHVLNILENILNVFVVRFVVTYRKNIVNVVRPFYRVSNKSKSKKLHESHENN